MNLLFTISLVLASYLGFTIVVCGAFVVVERLMNWVSPAAELRLRRGR